MRSMIIRAIGLAVLVLNLLALLVPGMDMASNGIFSTQPLFHPGALRYLPLVASVVGIVAGYEIFRMTVLARVALMANAILVALAAPLWAQQADNGFSLYTSHPPVLAHVVIMCAVAVVFAITVGIVMNLPGVKSEFPSYQPQENHSAPRRLMHNMLNLLLLLCGGYIFRNSVLNHIAARTPWSRLILWPLAGITMLLIYTGGFVALSLIKLFIPQQLQIYSSDYATASHRIAELQKYGAVVKEIPNGAIIDAAYEINRYNINTFGPHGYDCHIAIQVDPHTVPSWTSHWEQESDRSLQLESTDREYLAELGTHGDITSVPITYSITNGHARVYQHEGIILIDVMD